VWINLERISSPGGSSHFREIMNLQSKVLRDYLSNIYLTHVKNHNVRQKRLLEYGGNEFSTNARIVF